MIFLDRVVVLWRGNNGKEGLLHTKITEDSISTDQVDHPTTNPQDVFSSTESVEYPTIPTVKKPCRIQVLIEKNIKHDFTENPVCLVPFSLVVENYLPGDSVFRYKTENRDFFNQQDLGRFLGCTKASVPMTGQSKRKFNFHVTVSCPGLYSYNGLSFQMTNNNEECDTDEFIPLEVDFIVE